MLRGRAGVGRLTALLSCRKGAADADYIQSLFLSQENPRIPKGERVERYTSPPMRSRQSSPQPTQTSSPRAQLAQVPPNIYLATFSFSRTTLPGPSGRRKDPVANVRNRRFPLSLFLRASLTPSSASASYARKRSSLVVRGLQLHLTPSCPARLCQARRGPSGLVRHPRLVQLSERRTNPNHVFVVGTDSSLHVLSVEEEN